MVGREMAANRRAVAEHGAVDDRTAVERMGYGLTHPDIIEGRAGVVGR